MPIINISRIQHRRGLSSELPTALAEGELGFTLDSGQLFIGGPSFPPISNRTRFPYKNIEVLTEFSLRGLLENSLTYTYRYRDPTSPSFPGQASNRANENFTVERFLQERLDDIVSVKSYGAVGDGIADDTDALKKAIQDVTSTTVGKYRTLYFPAGTYLISEPLPIYPRSRWAGDGIGKTIISLSPEFNFQGSLNPTVDVLPSVPTIYDLYLITGSTGNFGRPDLFGIPGLSPGDQIYYSGIIGQEWKVVTTSFSCVLETANSDGFTGLNINDFTNNMLTTNSLPTDIHISGMTIFRNSVGDIVRLNRASNVLFENCNFQATWKCEDYTNALVFGVFENSSKYSVNRDGISVRIDSLSNLVSEILPCKNFAFLNCEFNNNTFGFYATDEIENVVVLNGKFYDMFRGVSLGEGVIYRDNIGTELTVPPTYDGITKAGPKDFKVFNSTFNKIYDTPYSVYTNNTGNISAFNSYSNYGYGNQSAWDPKTHFIIFGYPPSFEPPNQPRSSYPNTIWGYEVAPAVLFYANFDEDFLTYDNVSIGDHFDYAGTTPTIRVMNLSAYNTVQNTQDDHHIPMGMILGTVTDTQMSPRTLELPLGNQDYRTGIILDTRYPTRANDIIIDYSLIRGESSRKGQIHIVSDGLDVEWWESISDIGNPIDIEFTVMNTENRKVRVKFNDLRYPDTMSVPQYADKVYLRWAARYWDHALVSYGTYLAPVDGEVDLIGPSGVEDWGYITEGLTQPDDDYDLITNSATTTDYGPLY